MTCKCQSQISDVGAQKLMQPRADHLMLHLDCTVSQMGATGRLRLDLSNRNRGASKKHRKEPQLTHTAHTTHAKDPTCCITRTLRQRKHIPLETHHLPIPKPYRDVYKASRTVL
eukprot:5116005-Amphidinium_carterae.1